MNGGGFVLISRYTGQYFDAESGLVDNINRTYDPTIGRYMQSDPMGLPAGISAYAYVGNDPLNSIDPQGLQTLPPSTDTIDWTNPATRAAGAQYALNMVPGYALYNCASNGCGGWNWAFPGLGVLPGVGAASGVAKEVRAAGAMCEVTGAASSLQGFRLGQQLAAEEAAGVSAPTSISSYSTHSLEQIADRDAGVKVSQPALEDAFANPNTIQCEPSSYGPNFRYAGSNATVVVNPQGSVITGWEANGYGVGR